MPKKNPRRKRAASSTSPEDRPLMFTSDFSEFVHDRPPSRNSSSSLTGSRSPIDSDAEAELFAHFYFASTSDTTALDDCYRKSLNMSATITSSSSSSSFSSPVPSDKVGSTCKITKSSSKKSHSETSATGKDDREAIIVISDEDFSVMKAGKKGKKKSWKRKAPLSATPTVEKKRAIDEEEGEIIVVSSGSEVEGGVGSGHQSGSSEGGSEAMDLGNESDPDKSEHWSIIEKDLLGSDGYERKYGKRYARMLGRFMKCFNCKQKGHDESMCPHPKRHQVCYLCGVVGHVSMRCPDSRCQYCFQRNHRGRPCNTAFAGRCTRCYMIGHIDTNCSDGWRQFHNTTSEDRMLVKLSAHEMQCSHVNRSHIPSCANCAQSGHYAHECSRLRPRGVPLPFFPYIAHYDDSAYQPRPHQKQDDYTSSSSKHGQHRMSLPNMPTSKNKRQHKKKRHREKAEERERSKKRRRSEDSGKERWMPEDSDKEWKPHRRNSGDSRRGLIPAAGDFDSSSSSSPSYPRRTYTDPGPHSTPYHHYHHPPPPPPLPCSPPPFIPPPPPLPPPLSPFSPSPHGLMSPPLRSLSFEHSRTPEELYANYPPPPLPLPPPPPPPLFSPPPPPPPPPHFQRNLSQEHDFPRTPFHHSDRLTPTTTSSSLPQYRHRRHSDSRTDERSKRKHRHSYSEESSQPKVRVNINGYWDTKKGFVTESKRRNSYR